MLRLRAQRAERGQGGTGKEEERRQRVTLDTAEKLRQQSDAFNRQRQYDPLKTVDQLFGRM